MKRKHNERSKSLILRQHSWATASREFKALFLNLLKIQALNFRALADLNLGFLVGLEFKLTFCRLAELIGWLTCPFAVRREIGGGYENLKNSQNAVVSPTAVRRATH
ncbi:hypothetical protein [Campylobacter troglodytis]|uniref:hypothetical protein n=1 Tax=Campylobacter troglodytis TaxID=654363 RepID=UPI001159E865|nr:hypothetical protein [Campylobacter troglodytis]